MVSETLHLTPQRRSIVVGVDGSGASLNAVKWAVAEATNRDLPLRLVHAIPPATARRSRTECDRRRGERVLNDAEDTLEVATSHVCVESAVVWGDPATVLLEESRHAELVCVGSSRVEDLDRESLGPTAAALAGNASCSVAVIRTNRDGSTPDSGIVAVVLNDDPDNDSVVHAAMREGRLRHATVRLVDRRANSWIRRYPDVHVESVACGTGHPFLDGADDRTLQLAVVGQADAKKISELGPLSCHPILGYPDCSVLMVKH